MAALGTYYIDAEFLSGATAVFTDANMTIKAPDGYYSDGSTVRQQVSGVLGISIICPTCSVSCGIAINRASDDAIYDITFNTSTDTGCTIIYFEPYTRPHGIRATFNSNEYNELTSITEGYLASTDPSSYTYIGTTAEDCGIGATLDAGGYTGIDEYSFDGSSFVLSGSSGVVTGTSADVVTTVANPAYSTLYIPKTLTSPSDMNIQIFAPCPVSEFNIDINCPVLLTGIPTSDPSPADCNTAPLIHTFYNVPNRGGTAGFPAVNEFFVSDPYGNARVAAGDYTIEVAGLRYEITVSSDGIITSLAACPP